MNWTKISILEVLTGQKICTKNIPGVILAGNSRGERAGAHPQVPQDDPDTERGDQGGEAHQGGGRDWRLRPRRISPSAPGKADQPRAW